MPRFSVSLCGAAAVAAALAPGVLGAATWSVVPAADGAAADAAPGLAIESLKEQVFSSQTFQDKVAQACHSTTEDRRTSCEEAARGALFCQLLQRSSSEAAATAAATACGHDSGAPAAPAFLELGRQRRAGRAAPEDELAKEMTHDLEMNFNKIAPFGKEDTAKELQDHAAKTQDTLVDAVENAEVAEIKRAVFRALTRLRAATIKEFDTIARLETQAIDAYNDAHHYRAENPLAHLHEDEAPVETDKLKSFH